MMQNSRVLIVIVFFFTCSKIILYVFVMDKIYTIKPIVNLGSDLAVFSTLNQKKYYCGSNKWFPARLIVFKLQTTAYPVSIDLRIRIRSSFCITICVLLLSVRFCNTDNKGKSSFQNQKIDLWNMKLSTWHTMALFPHN